MPTATSQRAGARLRSTAVVALTVRGPRLPTGFPLYELDHPQLEWMRAMAGDGTGTGAVPLGDDVEQALLAALERSGFLLDEGSAPTAAGQARGPEDAESGEPVEADQLTDDDPVVCLTPVVLAVTSRGFVLRDDARAVLRLSSAEVVAAAALANPTTTAKAFDAQAEALGSAALDLDQFRLLRARLRQASLLRRFDADDPYDRERFGGAARRIRVALRQQAAAGAAVAAEVAAHRAAEQERAQRTGVSRPAVIPVHFQWQIPPLALGLVVARAAQIDGGALAERYDFQPTWLTRPTTTDPVPSGRNLFLFSNYIWSDKANLAYSAEVKAANPAAVTVFGGPDVPKYRGDLERWLRDHPHIDIAVRGEGEITGTEVLAALADAMESGDGPVDLSALADVPGVAFRDGDRVVMTADRERITELDALPSPYLAGYFDVLATEASSAVLETNRGCPYGCTFCDWGSATASRIRKFSMERVFAELDWCAEHQVPSVGIADANFGIFERDVEIAEHIAELTERTGFPRHVGLNYAKNTTKHLKHIVDIFAAAGVVSYGQLSLQSTDTDTLLTIRRSNIKVEKYDALAGEFRHARLPLYVDLMMGLPGATMDSFLDDLQQCIEREVIAKVLATQLLVNSPMNDPEYRQEHGITARPGELVRSTATFTEDEYREMERIRTVFLLAERFGILRHVARYVRQETGMREIDLMVGLWRAALADRDRFPHVAVVFDVLPEVMVPVVPWADFLGDVRRFVVEDLGVADDDALDTVLRVQRALLPARRRVFPETLDLPHDYATWYNAALDAKHGGHVDDWTRLVPSLRDMGPATFTVDDPQDVCGQALGQPFESDIFAVWDLGSPVSRPAPRPLDFAV